MSPSAREPRYAVLPTVAMPSGSQLSGRAITWERSGDRGGREESGRERHGQGGRGEPEQSTAGHRVAWVISPR